MKRRRPTRRRHNPLDIGQVRLTLPCAVALSELEGMGVQVVNRGDYLAVNAAEARARGGASLLPSLASCRSVVLYDPSLDAQIKREIVAAAARTGFEDAWFSEQESRVTDGLQKTRKPTPKSVPPSARKWAARLVDEFEKRNRVPVGLAYQVAVQLPGNHEGDSTTEAFGHYLAMQAVGHGIAWDDFHPDHGFDVPYSEYYL